MIYTFRKSNINLRLSDGTERFVQLGPSDETYPEKGEVVYADDEEVLCRRWNWRESDSTKLTEGTARAILVAETLPPFAEITLRAALGECISLLSKFCNAKSSLYILSKNNMSVNW